MGNTDGMCCRHKPTDLILVLADLARADPTFSGAFLAEFTRHLYGQNPNFAFANNWLEHRLADQGLTTEELVRAEARPKLPIKCRLGIVSIVSVF